MSILWLWATVMYGVVFEKDRFRVERISVLFTLKLFQNKNHLNVKNNEIPSCIH